jgi:hypothetical protein
MNAAQEFACKMHEIARSSSSVADHMWANANLRLAPCEAAIPAIVGQHSTECFSGWSCSCCCYAADYAMVCAFFINRGPIPVFIDVVTGSSCSGSSNATGLSEATVIACAYMQEFIVSTDSMSLYVYRWRIIFVLRAALQ